MPPRRVALISLGCAKNLVDAEDLLTTLRGLGFELDDDIASVDMVLINTCGFIDDAKRESIDHILDAADARGAHCKLFVTGCLTERYLDQLRAEMPEVDAWVPLRDYHRLADIVAEHFALGPARRIAPEARSQLTPPHLAYLKIAEGCDNACSFCAIPLIRGRHRSRPIEAVRAQARVLSQRGVREIVLVSQQLDYYGSDRYGRRRLAELVQTVAAEAPTARIRLHYCYPDHFDDDLIATMATTTNVLPYVDMPVQHGADAILARMGRRTDRARIDDRIAAIRAAMPEVVLRGSVIVGFPGETEEHFAALCDLVRSIGFDQLGAFPYSQEDGTRAATFPDQVDPALIDERYRRLMELQAGIHASRLERWVGREIEVLIDEAYDQERFAGRHYGQAYEVDNLTLVTADDLAPGATLQVRITGTDDYDLTAVPR